MYQVWDICKQSSMYTLETNQSAVSPDIHQSAPVFAVWTSTQNISLHSLYEGKVLNQIRYHEGLLGNRLGRQYNHHIPAHYTPPISGPVNCLRFHPTLVQLAAGSTDCHVSRYSYRRY